jgi:hypothetical protein
MCNSSEIHQWALSNGSRKVSARRLYQTVLKSVRGLGIGSGTPIAIHLFNKVVHMPEKSIFSRGGSGMTTGGLDRFLGPQAGDHSSLPDHTEDPANANDAREVDCKADPDEPVCQIADAERQNRTKDSAS